MPCDTKSSDDAISLAIRAYCAASSKRPSSLKHNARSPAAVDANVRRVHLEMAAAYEKHAGIEPQECAREKRPSEQVS